jgi:signal transduction histidine kinase
VKWFERQYDRVRGWSPLVVDSVVGVLFTVLGVVTVFAQDIYDDAGELEKGFKEPSALAVLTIVLTCLPLAVRRRMPLAALFLSASGVLVHILIGWPEGALPLAVLFITYTVGAWCPPRQALFGLALPAIAIVVMGIAGAPGLDAVGVFAVLAQFAAGWAIGVAMRHRRAATDARVREAEERAEAERQSTARTIAEERLRIAQELHDVVAHSMSVIAVQAGVGAHVLDNRPEQARTALEAISTTSRSTLAEMRRLLGVLRGDDGARSNAPAPALSDLPRLVDDVRAAGVPATLQVEGAPDSVHPGVELSAYRVVQEALTNVIKHAGRTSRVDVTVRYQPGSLAVEVTDDGRGLAAHAGNGGNEVPDGSGHGLIGMRERVELWGGELSAGPAPGGGYRVKALLPYGDAE